MNKITEEQLENLYLKTITIMEEFRKFLPNNTWLEIGYKCEYDSDGNPNHHVRANVSTQSDCEFFYIYMFYDIDENLKEMKRLHSYLSELTRNRRKVMEMKMETPEAIYGTGSEGFTHDEIG